MTSIDHREEAKQNTKNNEKEKKRKREEKKYRLKKNLFDCDEIWLLNVPSRYIYIYKYITTIISRFLILYFGYVQLARSTASC